MNWLVYHVVSGQAFFSGVALVVVAAIASRQTRPIFKRVAVLAFLVGIIAIVISSTAIPYWCYAVAAAATLAWIGSRFVEKLLRFAAVAVAAAWLFAALVELPFWFTPSLSPASARSVTVIGDSVTAGAGGEDAAEAWPKILARQHAVQVQDLSHVGDTAALALKRAKAVEIASPVVVVEIGGNDLLGSTTSARFAHDLDALLAHLAAPDRQIVMLELPLPPFYHEFGRIQRTLAGKHNVKLVPKRHFLSVLAGSGATLDSIHLSPSGHQRMADLVWRLVEHAFVTARISRNKPQTFCCISRTEKCMSESLLLASCSPHYFLGLRF